MELLDDRELFQIDPRTNRSLSLGLR
jgi:hypothetical protein